MQITAKVKCTSREPQSDGQQDVVAFVADYLSDEGKAINAEWATYTPALSYVMYVKPSVPFEVGTDYTLTFDDSALPLGPSAELVAQLFHETYERLAPDFGYRTREASAKPWDEVPDQNKQLMVAVAHHVTAELYARALYGPRVRYDDGK